MGQQYSHLSSEERILIEKLHCEQHLSIRRTAERIGRDKSTVSRELRRGLWFASNENGSYRPYRPKRLKTGPWTSGPVYSALAAQRKADRRRRGPRKPRRRASARPRAWGLDSLRRGGSPELIEGRLKARYAGDPSMRISHECLYQWIYAKPQRALDLRQYLARGRKRRTRKKGRKASSSRRTRCSPASRASAALDPVISPGNSRPHAFEECRELHIPLNGIASHSGNADSGPVSCAGERSKREKV